MVKYQLKFLGKNGRGPGQNLVCKLVKYQVKFLGKNGQGQVKILGANW